MAFPKITDFVTYINRKLTGNDWNTNFQKIVNWLSLGDTDIKVKSVEADSIKYNGTTIIQNGNINTNSITANTVTANSFIGDGSQLTNVRVDNTFVYTPFAINKAKSNFIINDTTKLTFDVSEENPLVITSAKGITTTIISINDYDVSGLNGTYYIFADEETNGGTVYLKTCDIYRQDTAPTGNNGDIWLDVSCEPYICKEKVSSNWNNEYDKVPIGKVVVTGGTITSLETLRFNDNGVNVKIVGNYGDTDLWCKVWSNGLIEQGGQVTTSETVDGYSDVVINFLVPFANTKYFLSAGNEGALNQNSNSIYVAGAVSKSTTNVRLSSKYLTNSNLGSAGQVTYEWYARGYKE